MRFDINLSSSLKPVLTRSLDLEKKTKNIVDKIKVQIKV